MSSGGPVLDQLSEDRLRVRVAGREFVVGAACPHRLGRLVHGHVNARTMRITCPLHHTSFELATGCPVAGPGTDRLPVYAAGPVGSHYAPEQVWLPASERLLEWDGGFHDLMLGDTLRMKAYHAAVTEAVRPGTTVLDLGTGTGILARWALEAGAAEVIGVDLNEDVLRTAVEQLAAVGFGPTRFRPVRSLSFELTLPRPVDLVVSEILGNLADNENCAAILDDARLRLLRPGGTMLPAVVDSYLVPVAAERAHAQIRDDAPEDAGGPVGFAALRRRRAMDSPFDLYYDAIVPRAARLADPQRVRHYDFTVSGAPHAPDYTTKVGYTVAAAGLFTGFSGYFMAQLSDSVVLDISGDDIAARRTSDSWKHSYLPIAAPVPVRPGDRIELTFERVTGGGPAGAFEQGYRWEGSVTSRGATVGRFAQSTRPEPR